MAEEIVDFLIIGSGPSGAAATWSLADTGARIMCMEQGDFMKQADYPSNFRDWEGREGHWPNLKKKGLRAIDQCTRTLRYSCSHLLKVSRRTKTIF